MRRTVLLLLVGCSLMLRAQPFCRQWISHREADSTSMVWFRHTFLTHGKPLAAHLRVASTGYWRVYVNEIRLGREAITPSRALGDTTVHERTYDLSRYLRRDTNVVAVLYCPSKPHKTRRQVALSLWGTARDGTPFGHLSGPDWFSRKAAMQLTGAGGELIDGRDDGDRLSAQASLVDWQPSVNYYETNFTPTKNDCSISEYQFVGQRLQPKYFDVTGRRVEYEFPFPFYGYVRVTLRGCHRGERLCIDGSQYVCSGKMDEQFYCRFSPSFQRRVTISGDADFRQEQIQEVVAISLETRPGALGWDQ